MEPKYDPDKKYTVYIQAQGHRDEKVAVGEWFADGSWDDLADALGQCVYREQEGYVYWRIESNGW